MSDFTPSKYQAAVFAFHERGTGDAFVSAVAGSGKTTTLVQLGNRLSPYARQNAAFVAFNKHIVNELQSRLPGDFTVRTIHSLAYSALRKLYQWTGDPVDTRKYTRIAEDFAQDFFSENPDAEFSKDELVDNLAQAASKCRLTLTDPIDGSSEDVNQPLWDIMDRFGIDNLHPAAMAEGVKYLLTTGRNIAGEKIDIDDMVWLGATEASLRPWGYDVLLVDECQDLNRAQQEFILRIQRGRAFFVGDPRQAIYGFAGADVQAVQTLSEKTGCEHLPLSICYRCPSSHVRLAKQIVPEIECSPTAKDGHVRFLPHDDLMGDIGGPLRNGGPLVLCRTTQPLIELCFNLIRKGVPATVKGRDIGKTLNNLVDAVSKHKEFDWRAFPEWLETHCMKRIKLLSRHEQHGQIQALNDKWQTVALIHEKAVAEGVDTMDEFKAYTGALFSEEAVAGAPTLSTVHKAKGLENDHVYLLKPDLMPHPMARKPHEIEQEWNVKYIALTRSKSTLTFIEDNGRDTLPSFAREERTTEVPRGSVSV